VGLLFPFSSVTRIVVTVFFMVSLTSVGPHEITGFSLELFDWGHLSGNLTSSLIE
jgi:hypothetical protein